MRLNFQHHHSGLLVSKSRQGETMLISIDTFRALLREYRDKLLGHQEEEVRELARRITEELALIAAQEELNAGATPIAGSDQMLATLPALRSAADLAGLGYWEAAAASVEDALRIARP